MVNEASADRCSDPGCFVDGEHRFAVRVYFEDTDLTGVVYHANYLRYIERARSDMLRAAGISQRAAFEHGEGAYAVTAIDVQYKRPARLDDELLVLSHITEIRAASVFVHQRVMRDGELVASANVQVAFLGPAGRPRRQPAAWTRAYRGIMGANSE